MAEGTLAPERPPMQIIGREPSQKEKLRMRQQQSRERGEQERPDPVKKAFELKRDLHRVEEELSKVTPESLEAAKGGGESPGVALRKEKDWSRFGWKNRENGHLSDKEEVQLLVDQLGTYQEKRGEEIGDDPEWKKYYQRFRLNDMQKQVLLELMVASGKKPSELKNALKKEAVLAKLREGGEKWEGHEALLFFAELGIDERNLQRYVFFKEYHRMIDNDYQDDPENAEDLAWQLIHYRNKDKWRPGDDFPLLDMHIVLKKDEHGRETKEIDTEESDFYINQGNMIEWIRDFMWQLHDASPKEMQNFFGDVHITKKFGQVSMMDMYLQKDRYLKSRNGKTMYEELALQVLLEGVMFLQAKKSDVELRPVLADLDGITKKIMEQFDRSPFTSDLGPGNLLFFMMSAPMEFRAPGETELPQSDGIMGSIWNHLNLAYRSLSDVDELHRILGPESSFFTKQGMWNAMKAGWKGRQAFTGDIDPRSFLPQGKYKLFEEAFYPSEEEIKRMEQEIENFQTKGLAAPDSLVTALSNARQVPGNLRGKIKNQEKFKQLINFFKERTPNDNHIRMVRSALKTAMAELYGQEDPDNPGTYALFNSDGKQVKTALDIAEVWSYSWNLLTGTAVLNAEGIPAFNAMLKPMEAGAYWRKYSDYRGGLGNPLNMFWVKRFADTFLEGIPVTDMVPVTELVHKQDARGKFLYEVERDDQGNPLRKHGRVVYKKDARGERIPVMEERIKPGEMRRMSLLDVMQQHQEVNMKQRQYIRRIQEELQKIDPNDASQAKARAYLEGRLARAKADASQMVHQVANRLEFSQDAQNQWAVDQWERSVHLYKLFEGAKEIKFQDFVVTTPYGIQFEKEKFIPEFVKNIATPTRYWATAGLGDLSQIVRRKVWDPRLKKEVFKDMPMGEAKLGYQVLNREAFWKKKANGMWEYDAEGKHVIDYNKIEKGEGERAGKKLLWKNVILMKLASDLKSHLSIHMSDPQFTLDQKVKMIQTIKEIAGPYVGSDKDIKNIKMIDTFYSKQDIRWALDVAGAHYYNLAWQEFWGMFMPKHDKKEDGAMTIFLKNAFTLAA